MTFGFDTIFSEKRGWLVPLIVVHDNPAVRQKEVPVTIWKHLSEEDIDSYCLDQFEGTKLEEVETHLLLCENCQRLVDDTDIYIATLREHLMTVACQSARLQ
jgi:hypothetical protein